MKQSIRFCTSSDGVKLAYAVTGDGPPLVMSATWLTHLEPARHPERRAFSISFGWSLRRRRPRA